MQDQHVTNIARRPFGRLLRSRLVSSLTSPRNVDDYLQLVDAAWSVWEVRARLVGVRQEEDQSTSLWLRPNGSWRGFRAGQFVQLSVAIGGVRHTRCFSLSSAPEDGLPLRLTIKAMPGGRVSGWARAAARVGDVVGLSQALGNFVLPDPLPGQLLFVSGGSGITPILSMVRHLAAVGYDGAIAWMHFARSEVTFADELARLAKGRLAMRLSVILTRADRPTRSPVRFSLEQLEGFEPAWTSCEAFVCGPEALSRAATRLWRSRSLDDQLHVERFTLAPQPPPTRDTSADYRLVFAKSGREGEGRSGVSLLEQAEWAGLRPPYGCRMGICHTCVCRKVSGTVRNAVTGEASGNGDQEIRLCVSTPLSDVILDL
jgi:ferredoxin-NADP reductase